MVTEILADYTQCIATTAGDLPKGIETQPGWRGDAEVELWGGGVLVFDQFGRFRLHQRKPILDVEPPERRLANLVARDIQDPNGGFGTTDGTPTDARFCPAARDCDGGRVRGDRAGRSLVRLRAYQVGFGDCLLLTVDVRRRCGDGRRGAAHPHRLRHHREAAEDGPTLAKLAPRSPSTAAGTWTSSSPPTGTEDHIGGFGDRRRRETSTPSTPVRHPAVD